MENNGMLFFLALMIFCPLFGIELVLINSNKEETEETEDKESEDKETEENKLTFENSYFAGEWLEMGKE